MALNNYQAAVLSEHPVFRAMVRLKLFQAGAALAGNTGSPVQSYAQKILRGEYDLTNWSAAVASAPAVLNGAGVNFNAGPPWGITDEVQTAVEGLLPAFKAANP